MAQTEDQEEQQQNADRFVQAMRSIMSLSPEASAAIRSAAFEKPAKNPAPDDKPSRTRRTRK